MEAPSVKGVRLFESQSPKTEMKKNEENKFLMYQLLKVLMYAQLYIATDIAYVISVLTIFQFCHGMGDQAVKKVMRFSPLQMISCLHSKLVIAHMKIDNLTRHVLG